MKRIILLLLLVNLELAYVQAEDIKPAPQKNTVILKSGERFELEPNTTQEEISMLTRKIYGQRNPERAEKVITREAESKVEKTNNAPCPKIAKGKIETVANDGRVVGSEGGSLNLFWYVVGHLSDPTINNSGEIAFYSWVDGPARNQGIFLSSPGRDQNNRRPLEAILWGCGRGGGSGDTQASCGDNAPGGGKFAGLHGGIAFHWGPKVNEHGDIAFISDINHGDTTRGIFIYRKKSKTIERIAAINDKVPNFGTIKTLGIFDFSDNGDLVFLASPVSEGEIFGTESILKFSNGSIKKLASIGDTIDGNRLERLATALVQFGGDGTSILTFPAPNIDENGTSFFAAWIEAGGDGIFSVSDSESSLLLRSDALPPVGNYYDGLMQQVINGPGSKIAFSALVEGTDRDYIGRFGGHPQNIRSVLLEGDTIPGLGEVKNATVIMPKPHSQLIGACGAQVLTFEIDNFGSYSGYWSEQQPLTPIHKEGDQLEFGRVTYILDNMVTNNLRTASFLKVNDPNLGNVYMIVTQTPLTAVDSVQSISEGKKIEY